MLFQTNETTNTNINLLNLTLQEENHLPFRALHINRESIKKKVYRTKPKIILTKTTQSERCLFITFRD